MVLQFTPVETLVIAAISGLSGVWLGHRLASFRDSEKRRMEFRGFIAELRSGCERFQEESLIKYHAASVDKIVREATKIMKDVYSWRRKQFRAAVDDYRSKRRTDISNPDYSKKVKLASPPTDYEKGRKVLIECLDRISSYVH